ncbi:retinoblastoma-like protein 2 [Pollicipes pollicipes]|uniref:retinoblastoma-like protein 2 n=1 Tax=Pollicipes pollicipes TaxID=41117 RepID=UPI001884D53D|nr:retinoblastoma-like protein 2 [Pollicipes pollicipes]
MPLPMPHPVLKTENMNAVDEKSDQIYEDFQEMCFDLNMDKFTARDAWNSYCQVKQNYSLEGKKLHWLACALYVSCRRGSVPTVGHHLAPMQGNFISLTRLLRFAQFSLLEFFDKSKKWAEMSNLPHPFQRNLDALERNFAVTTFLFNYYEPMFKKIYTDPADDPPRPPKSRKQRRGACTASDAFEFTWTLFVLVKSTIPSVSSDLVSTYHLLLACVDYMFGVTVAADRRDLLNRSSPALPENFNSRDYEPPADVPCILEYLCSQFNGLIIEAKSIRRHVWKEKIVQMFASKTLHGDPASLTGILDLEPFELNWKSVNKRYEEYLLTCGNFDERTFLGERAGQEIGTPSKANNYSVTAGDLAERIHVRRNLMLTQNKNVLMPSTPLTGRGYLRAEPAPANSSPTPITASMYSVSRLQALLDGRRPAPSPQLAALFSSCSPDPTETIATLVAEFKAEFSAACAGAVDGADAPDLVDRRFHMAACFFYKTLESVLLSERRRKPDINLLVLLDQSVFHRCLLACSLEIVLFSYNTAPLEFPWLLEALNIEPYDFYKLLEIIIREEQGLCRDVIKHLNKVEEHILDSMAWRRCSRLWTVIEAAGTGNIPTSETVTPHLQEAAGAAASSAGTTLLSPAPHNPTVRRLFVTYSSRSAAKNPQQSPLSSATERFMSPVVPSSARRRLFVAGPRQGVRGEQPAVTVSPALERRVRTYSLITPTPTPAPTLMPTPTSVQTPTPGADTPPMRPKQNSLGLFFRKFYYLASVRIRDLCERLKLMEDVRETIWTVFEFVIVHHVTVMQGRHLDQLIMSAIFVVCKAFGMNKKFTDIMGMYRCQPQAKSHVYRSVLLGVNQKTDGAGGEERLRPVPAPLCPPTPSRMAGTATSYEFEDRNEERGDIIQFYNQVFVVKVKAFVSKFSKSDGKPPLSPLPSPRLSPLPLSRKVSAKHSIYISPLKQSPGRFGERGNVRSYSFNRSPAHELRSINAMVKPSPLPAVEAGKRLRPLLEPAGADESEPKRYKARLRDVLDQRQANVGE